MTLDARLRVQRGDFALDCALTADAGETLVLADEDAPEEERCGPLREAVRALRVRQREARGGLRGL